MNSEDRISTAIVPITHEPTHVERWQERAALIQQCPKIQLESPPTTLRNVFLLEWGSPSDHKESLSYEIKP